MVEHDPQLLLEAAELVLRQKARFLGQHAVIFADEEDLTEVDIEGLQDSITGWQAAVALYQEARARYAKGATNA